jgi:putative ABC transport system ATP-binding protein
MMIMEKDILLVTRNITKEYSVGDIVTRALDDVSLAIHAGEFVAITGKSGSGKSTLMYQMSLLDDPTSGDVIFRGERTAAWSGGKRIRTRLESYGFVFQDYALVPELTAVENVSLPHFMQTGCFGECAQRAATMLERVGLGTKLHNRPSQLSGGEQQRVSIARALVNDPEVLFADEPTANLDTETSAVVLDIFKELHSKGLTIVMVTHEPEYAKLAERIIQMKDGKIV